MAAGQGDDVMAIRLQLIGSGPEEEALKQLAETLKLSDVVEFVGGMAFDDVLASLQAADAFALAPRLIPGHPPDGIPNVIAESMALRIPVVTTRVSAIPELVEDSRSGLLVEVDDYQAMASALMKVATDENLARSLADEAYLKVDQLFNQEQNINELLELFSEYTAQSMVSESTTHYPDSSSGEGRRAA